MAKRAWGSATGLKMEVNGEMEHFQCAPPAAFQVHQHMDSQLVAMGRSLLAKQGIKTQGVVLHGAQKVSQHEPILIHV